MKALKLTTLGLIGAASALFSMSGWAQVSVGVGIGVAPACAYGYYDEAPYGCAPYGYYGPEWFNGGVFIGTGPWFHGPDHFRGTVDNHFHPSHGYAGPMPRAGEAANPAMRPGAMSHFEGNEYRDGHGNSGPTDRR